MALIAKPQHDGDKSTVCLCQKGAFFTFMPTVALVMTFNLLTSKSNEFKSVPTASKLEIWLNSHTGFLRCGVYTFYIQSVITAIWTARKKKPLADNHW